MMSVIADPVADARDLAAALFPHTRWALLTGSVITQARTAGSDLDMVIVLPDGDPQAPHRDSRRFRGWPVELFVHDEATLGHYLATELADRKPHLHRMLGCGVAVAGDPGRPWPRHCAQVLAGGPPPLSEAERRRVRYGLTDICDDLEYATDADERLVIAASAWRSAGQATLSLNSCWSGAGKWLSRQLRELRGFDAAAADRWLSSHGDPQAIAAYVTDLLAAHGGPLFDGHRAEGQRP